MSFVRKFSFFLLPSVFQGVISIVILPITTRILGPEEYGVFALLTSLVGLGTVFASAGVGYVMAANYPVIADEEKKKLVSSTMIVGILIAFLFSAGVLLFWPIVASTWNEFAQIPRQALYLSLIAMVLGLPWTLSLDVITLEGKAKLFAMSLILQSIVTSAVVILSLYVFRLGLLSLFFGSVAGSAIVGISVFIALWRRIIYKGSLKWMSEILKMGFLTAPASLFENAYVLVERTLLSVYVGMAQLGLFTHSQQYRALAMMVVKAGARTVAPITLAEAREQELNFVNTKKTWDAMYVLLIFAGIISATFGKYIISVLTNGKFTEAYIFVVFWMIYLLIQNTGKPHTGVFYAFNRGASYALMQIIALAVGLASLLFLVPYVGVYGAVAALFLQMIVLRILIQIQARKLQKIPFQDWWVVYGVLLILTTLFISWYFKFGVAYNLFLLLVMTTLLLISAQKIVKEVAAKI